MIHRESEAMRGTVENFHRNNHFQCLFMSKFLIHDNNTKVHPMNFSVELIFHTLIQTLHLLTVHRTATVLPILF